jgi:cellulose synthase/poly-beta-1,6-N-acetylglucosamine synthase-like glycosyltransferase
MDLLTALAEVGLWVCLGVVAYVYVGYPLTLLLVPAHRIRTAPGSPAPTVTVVIAAFNEVRHIETTVRNKLAQDYPAELLDVIVVSDGSVDGTDAVVAGLGDPRVTLLRQEPRQGKTLALNRALQVARGEIVVFSDANSWYEASAISALVRQFADPQVGYATGRLLYEDPGATAVGGGSGLYMTYEAALRRLESRAGSIVGVNGGIDAVRRSLYQPMRADHLPDFVLPLRVVAQGYRVVNAEQAIAREAALGEQGDEFRMRVRVSLRALHGLMEMRALLHPRHGLFAFQLLVHKLLRYLMIVPLTGAFLCNALLIGNPIYAALFTAQAACYAAALIGWRSGGRIRFRPVFVPFYFCLINVAAGVAFVGFLRGERQILWTPRKGA